jgi:hypothetical protein
MTSPDTDLAAQVKAWRGKVPARVAAERLGIPKRTIDNIEQGRGFPYPRLLIHALKTIPIEGKK